ncbi:MutS-related protein [Cellulosilyticum ruminicola]|uniref:MutS-related protein n=1 Tax=Cellulosilyticum ruminicola TaxID=425254 RepID=UPI0006D1826B|nr:hypothetical protein [Cellulosilyticum ruminicola]
MKKEAYQARIKIVDEKIQTLNKKLRQLETLRVIAFLTALGSLIIGTAWHEKIYFIGTLGCVIGFIALVHKHHQMNDKKKYELAKRTVIEDNVKRLDKGWLNFAENGSEFINEDIPRIKDLDLLGKGSLFQYLCTAHTPYGKKALADSLVYGIRNEEIKKRQAAIKELNEKAEFTLHLKTLSKLIGMEKNKVDIDGIRAFIDMMHKDNQTFGKVLKGLSLALPFATFFSIVAILLRGESSLFAIIGSISIVMQIGLAVFYYGRHNEIFSTVLNFSRNIKAYKDFLIAVENEEFETPYLKSLKQMLCEDEGLKKGLETLYKLSEALHVRLNGVAYLTVSGLLMWDFHCKDALDIWQKQYGTSVEKWLSVMGEMEALLSLGILCEVKESYSYPEIEALTKPVFSFKALEHPLIQDAVANDLVLKDETCIITGSNMSGKTTFLRTIGINLALAYAGAPVLAKDFYAARMNICTSMRIQDDVNEGISSFYAELLRIKGMIDQAPKKEPMLVLIDEIFKGTNSADRILGAKETIKSLEKPWITIMVSTHDFELCEIEESMGRKVFNYHFEEHYVQNKIRFDYKLKIGRCRTTNAQFLLKMVGIYK